MSTLAEVWSLDKFAKATGSNAPILTADHVDQLLLNDSLMSRWLCHNTAVLLTMAPTSETRLREDGLIAIYGCSRGLTASLKHLAHKRGLSVPPVPEAAADWKEEAASDLNSLTAALLPEMAASFKQHAEFLAVERSKNHWTSMVAAYTVIMTLYLSAMRAAKSTVEGSKGPRSYMEALVMDETLAPHAAKVMSDDLAQCTQVMNEELLRIKDAPEETR